MGAAHSRSGPCRSSPHGRPAPAASREGKGPRSQDKWPSWRDRLAGQLALRKAPSSEAGWFLKRPRNGVLLSPLHVPQQRLLKNFVNFSVALRPHSPSFCSLAAGHTVPLVPSGREMGCKAPRLSVCILGPGGAARFPPQLRARGLVNAVNGRLR